MSNTKLRKHVPVMNHMLDVLHYALEEHYIDANQAFQQTLAYQQLLYQQILYFNHKNSTSISTKNYQRLEKAIYYMICHASIAPIYTLVSTHTILALYDKGALRLRMEVTHLLQQLQHLQAKILPFSNERYEDVIFQQIPRYLSTLRQYEAPFTYYHISEDLDYPLIDGIPLFSHMYHRDGVDLVKEYMRRLNIEESFCSRFRSTIPSLMAQYELQKGIQIHDIHMNLFELLCHQCFANIILYEKESILLQAADIQALHTLLHTSSQLTIITKKVVNYIETLPQNIQSYIFTNKEIIIEEWRKFLHTDYALFIYEQAFSQQINVSLPGISDHFIMDMNSLCARSSIQEKLAYIKQHAISIYDMFDLLQHGIFYEEEYVLYFQTLSIMEHALILKLQVPHSNAFHIHSILDDILNEFDYEYEWQKAWKYYIQDMPSIIKEEIKEYASKLILTSS